MAYSNKFSCIFFSLTQASQSATKEEEEKHHLLASFINKMTKKNTKRVLKYDYLFTMAKQLIKTPYSNHNPNTYPHNHHIKIKNNKCLFYARMSLTKAEVASKINNKKKMAESIFLFANCFSSSRT